MSLDQWHQFLKSNNNKKPYRYNVKCRKRKIKTINQLKKNVSNHIDPKSHYLHQFLLNLKTIKSSVHCVSFTPILIHYMNDRHDYMPHLQCIHIQNLQPIVSYTIKSVGLTIQYISKVHIIILLDCYIVSGSHNPIYIEGPHNNFT